MAALYRQSTTFAGDSTFANTAVKVFGSNVLAGSTLVAYVSWGANGSTDITSVTDTLGNVYTRVAGSFVNDSNDTQSGEAWVCAASVAAGANTVQVNFAAVQPWRGLCIYEISGLNTTPLNGRQSTFFSVATTAFNTTPDVTPTVSGCFCVGFAINSGSGSSNASGVSAPWTALREVAGTAGSQIFVASEDLVQGSATAIHTAFTFASTTGFATLLVLTPVPVAVGYQPWGLEAASTDNWGTEAGGDWITEASDQNQTFVQALGGSLGGAGGILHQVRVIKIGGMTPGPGAVIRAKLNRISPVGTVHPSGVITRLFEPNSQTALSTLTDNFTGTDNTPPDITKWQTTEDAPGATVRLQSNQVLFYFDGNYAPPVMTSLARYDARTTVLYLTVDLTNLYNASVASSNYFMVRFIDANGVVQLSIVVAANLAPFVFDSQGIDRTVSGGVTLNTTDHYLRITTTSTGVEHVDVAIDKSSTAGGPWTLLASGSNIWSYLGDVNVDMSIESDLGGGGIITQMTLDNFNLVGSSGANTKGLTGAVTDAGSVVRQTAKIVAGTVTDAGVLVRRSNRLLTGGITPGPGTVLRAVQRVLLGAITPGPGVLVRAVGRLLAGAITPGPGTMLRRVSKLLTAAQTSAGNLGNRVAKAVSGSITPAGIVTAIKANLRSFTGGATTTGSLLKRVGRLVLGTVTPGPGTLSRLASKLVSGAVTSGGVVTTIKVKLLTVTGSIIPGPGTVVRGLAKGLTAAVTPGSGTVVRRVTKLLGGTGTAAGTVLRLMLKPVTGAVTSAGSVLRQLGHPVTGTIASSGTAVKQVSKAVTGVNTTAGALVRRVTKLVGGTITSSATLTTIKVKLLAVVGAMTPGPGALVRRSGRVVSGSIPSAGVMRPQAAKVVLGTVPSGAALTPRRQSFLVVTGAVTSAATVIRQSSKGLSAAITPSAGLLRQVSKALIATMLPTGTIGRRFVRTMAGTVTSAGTVTRSRSVVVVGTLTTGASLARKISVNKLGALTPTGALQRALRRALTGIVTSGGSVSRGFVRTTSGSINPRATLLRLINAQHAGLIIPQATFASSITSRTFVLSFSAQLLPALAIVTELKRALAMEATIQAALVTDLSLRRDLALTADLTP